MPANYFSQLVGVLGYPVAENPTGVMQEAAFRAIGLNWRYILIEVRPDSLPGAMQGVRAFGMQGINLTIPHKVAVLALLDSVSPDATLIGAVNTVRREGNRLVGENTDGKGFLRGLRQEAGIDPRDKRIVILGAGGASRAIAFELALAGARELVVVNRDPARGEALVKDLISRTGANANFLPWSGTFRIPPEADIFVNATSIGLYPDVDAMPDIDLSAARQNLLVCDVVPNPPQTRLIRAAEARGLPVLAGLAMLVYQGAIAFEMWTGQAAPEEVMKTALVESFST